MALIFGAPDTVPAGKIDRKASNLSFTMRVKKKKKKSL